ncbi:DUF1294 domain-containing protein [Flavobacterium ajazii]|uniref:DUF1294 domain-containing protein n=1 Tax=Flavobacterium ajazii TaxID=2692318 RepID=UPI0013D7284A|nr:DUF1294 domain-containing protein [Flavobacterium ajazii]
MILFYTYLFINLVVFILAGYDKHQAIKNKRRIPENTLFFLALIGGSIGLLTAMLIFTHKTGKTSFIVKFAAIILVQIGLIYFRLTNKI